MYVFSYNNSHVIRKINVLFVIVHTNAPIRDLTEIIRHKPRSERFRQES